MCDAEEERDALANWDGNEEELGPLADQAPPQLTLATTQAPVAVRPAPAAAGAPAA